MADYYGQKTGTLEGQASDNVAITGGTINGATVGATTPAAGAFTTITGTSSVTLGVASGATGSVVLKGTTSGTVTLSVEDTAGTYTLKLPTSDGDANQLLQTDGSGNTTWATVAAGGGDMLLGTAQTVTASKTFGDDLLILAGSTSGTTKLNAADAAGTTTVTFPATTGTVQLAGENVTVGSGKTLDVSAGTLTLAVNQISGDNVEGGTIAATTITTLTSTTANITTLDTNVAAAGVTLSGTTLSADGTDADINIAITPKGTGEVDITKVDIDGGAIDATTIGGSTPAAGAFTTLKMTTGAAVGLVVSDISGNLVADSTPALGTPSTGTLTNCTGLPLAGLAVGSAENDFIVAGASPFTFAAKTIADTKTLLHASPGAIGETTPSTIRGKNKEIYKTENGTLTAAECSGTIVSNYGMTDADCTIDLPTAEEGLAFICILPAVRAKFFKLHCPAAQADKIYLSGVAGSDDGNVGVASGYATGASCSMFTFKASNGGYDWFCIPLFGTWVAS